MDPQLGMLQPYPESLLRLRQGMDQDPAYTYGNILPFKQSRETGKMQLTAPGIIRQAGRGILDLMAGTRTGGPFTPSGEFNPEGPLMMMGMSGLGRAPVTALAAGGGRGARRGATAGVLADPDDTFIPAGLGHNNPPLPTYPQAGAFEPKPRTRGREGTYDAKVHTPEEAVIAQQVQAAQADITAGNYTPHFDVDARTDVDIAKYGETGAATTMDEAAPRTKASIEKYKNILTDPDIRKRLQAAYANGVLIDNARNWYFVGQLEQAFADELGEEAGRKAFLEKFVKPMGATTALASPTQNFRMSMYGNYLRERGQQMPGQAYDVPYPVGGFGIVGNLAQHGRLSPEAYFDARTNPKRHNFGRNFLGDADVSTIDAQMMEAMTAGRLKEPTGPSYANYQQVVAEEAAKMGVTPREFQEVVWNGAKQLKEGEAYRGAKPMIEIVNEAIERTARITGMSPDDVVREGIVHSRIPIYSGGPGALIAGSAGTLAPDRGQQGQMVY